MIARELVDALRENLRRDPSDGTLALLLTIAVRSPFVVYDGERPRLQSLADRRARRTARETLIHACAIQLLTDADSTPAGEPGGPLEDE